MCSALSGKLKALNLHRFVKLHLRRKLNFPNQEMIPLNHTFHSKLTNNIKSFINRTQVVADYAKCFVLIVANETDSSTEKM